MTKIFFYMCIIGLFLYQPAAYSFDTKIPAHNTKKNILILADDWPPMTKLSDFLTQTQLFKIDTLSQEHVTSRLHHYNSVFMYVHKPLLKNVEKALIDYTVNGGRLIVLHHGIASAKLENPEWLRFVGIDLYTGKNHVHRWNVLHETRHTVVNLVPDHFITSNNIIYTKKIHFETDYADSLKGTYPAFDLENTEIFVNQRFTKNSERKVLFGFKAADSNLMQPTSGWYKSAGKGWLFYYQPGHSPTDFADKNFKQILLNTLLWQPT